MKKITKSALIEMITDAHMAGQMHAGCKHPSYGDARAHYSYKVEAKLKNLGEGEAGTGYALLSDGWRDGKNDKPKNGEEVIICEKLNLLDNKTGYDYMIGKYRDDDDIERPSIVERHTGNRYNINNYKWKRLTAPSF